MILKTSKSSNLNFRLRTVLLSLALISMAAAVPNQAQAQLTTPFVKQHIYSETANPTADIAAALTKARAEHKRVILDFGGDWCPDCQVLDIYFRQQPNADLLAKHFIVVHVYIGHMDLNLDIPKKYGVPINKGVPALAVIDAHGKLLYSQQTGQFENMRNMSSSDVTAFLNQWKA
ncbi:MULTISPECIES: thioredoxin family protein [Acidobacteriaceae]|uniref:thioredoxin family protein n=1 Tax=Acidobacteriaceae TaxID=204434 RepID=UPI0020B17457|nr:MULTISPECIES: thioredoxin family protein [Acidobacteriaceae]MDW5264269.1 thioredoxin family protein [Edaphobacter sp.]